MTDIKTKTENKEIIIMGEGLLESWLKDGFTLIGLFAMFYLNHTYTDGSWLIDLAILIFFFLILTAKRNKTRKDLTLDETIKYLEEMRAKNSA